MPNALARETSPYLLQHRDNPVDWLPWGEVALGRARAEQRPLLVSIGYSACHWCHVMERESFEDPQVAALMNEHFVCVKVDREERPDVDALYMEAVQAMTGQGGWPLNVFLTPEQIPFYGGTYFPPEPRHGMPSWPQVLGAIGEAWSERREQIVADAGQISVRLRGGALLEPSATAMSAATRDKAVAQLRASYDSVNGGWGGRPKFPAASAIEFLLACGEQAMALQTLRSMASGGIHDQVGGGFARYSVDATWTVPHFEKMLYDNALLARAYLHGWLASGDPVLRRTCEETLDWALREMRGPEGGFYSALDADSEGVEGRYYVWGVGELVAALGRDADAALAWLGARDQGNFAEGRAISGEAANILESRGPEPEPAVRERIRARLLEVRERRVRPGTDDKRLASWNALMISALADAGAVLERPDYLDAACATARFLLATMRDADGRLLRTYNRGEAKLQAYLEDLAFLLEALLALYEATFEEEWFEAARTTADDILARFADPERGGFFSTADDAPALVARRKELEDTPIPAGGSSAALGLLRLALLTGEARYEEAALGHLRLVHELAARHPTAFGHALQAIDLHVGPAREVAIVGAGGDPLERVVRGGLHPRLVLAGRRFDADPDHPTHVALLAGRGPVEGRAAAYVCERFACRAPVTDPAALAILLEDADGTARYPHDRSTTTADRDPS
ncbi:MAG TPA: thioredoxin domain-containing protein [Solirubrobacteraceae bacterium]